MHEARSTGEVVNRRAIVSDWHRSQSGSLRQKQLPRRRVPRLLDRNFVAGIEQEACAQIKSLLRSADDDDLFGGTANGSRSGEISGEVLPESGIAGRLTASLEACGGRFAQMSRDQPSP